MAKRKKMGIHDALNIVYELAEQNALDPKTCDPELRAEARRQHEALDIVAGYDLELPADEQGGE